MPYIIAYILIIFNIIALKAIISPFMVWCIGYGIIITSLIKRIQWIQDIGFLLELVFY